MRGGHGGAEPHRLPPRTALTDQVGRDHGLAVARRDRVPDAEDDRQQHSEERDRQGELLAGDEAGVRRGQPVHTVRQDAAARDGRVAAARATGLDAERGGGDGGRRAEQVGRVGLEQGARALPHHVAGDRAAQRGRRHLLPAGTPRRAAVLERHRRRGHVRTDEGAVQAQRRQARGPLDPARTGAGDGERGRPPVQHQRQLRDRTRALRRRPGAQLTLGEGAVAVGVRGVRGLRQLQGRDLGQVDSVLDPYLGRADDHAVGRVDGEVAERVRGGRRRQGEEQAPGKPRDGQRAGAGPPHDRSASSARARGACSGLKAGLSSSARSRAVRAAARSPAAASTTPRW